MIYILIPTTKERRHRLEKCINSIRESVCPYSFTICTYENENDGGWARACKKMVEGIDDLIFIVNDDMIVEQNCIRILYEKYIETFPENDGIMNPFDTLSLGENCDIPFCHSSVIKPFLDIGYWHYAGQEISRVMKQRAKYAIADEAIVVHEHADFIPGLMDETYRKAHLHINEDMHLLNSRKEIQ